MIKNERQYRITKTQADKFAQALSSLRSRQGSDPHLMQLERNALESQIDELRNQLENYERRKSGESDVIVVDSFDELPQPAFPGSVEIRCRVKINCSVFDSGIWKHLILRSRNVM